MDANILQKIAIFAIPVIFAITLHEAAHAYAARYFGDSTAYMLGRMTLNPAKHIDPIWTILVPLLTMLFTPFIFGAAKPVPVNFGGLRNPKQHMIWVAAAGPFANLVMMVIWGIAARVAVELPPSLPVQFLFAVGKAGVFVNALLMVFNLFPLLPLDGGRILAGLLPNRLSYQFSRTEPYGMFILIGLMLTGILGIFMWPLIALSVNSIYAIMGLS